MLVPPADGELAQDGDGGGQSCNGEIVGAKEKTQREGRNQRALGIERRHVEIAGTGILRE